MDITELKKQAAYEAAKLIKSDMVVGLGTGSTAIWATRRIGELIASGELHDIIGIPTSDATAQEARSLAIPLSTLATHPLINITIDGADEIDPDLNLIKGGRGALYMERKVAVASKLFVVVADESKLSPYLGTKFYVPVQVDVSQIDSVQGELSKLGTAVVRKSREELFLTDQGDAIIDLHCGKITDATNLAQTISQIPGVKDHGLFLSMADTAYISTPQGVQVM